MQQGDINKVSPFLFHAPVSTVGAAFSAAASETNEAENSDRTSQAHKAVSSCSLNVDLQ